MKILLFGEFSGFFNCLKDGLKALGHDVFLASAGDGFKDYPSDFRWDSHFSAKLGIGAPVYNIMNIFSHKHLFSGYDVVLLIEPNNISKYTLLNKLVYDFLIKNNKKVYLSGAGDTCIMFNYWYNSNTKYREYYKGYLIENPKTPLANNPSKLKWEEYLMSKVDGYIPIWYEYMIPYKKYSNCKNIIRIPINPYQFEYKPNILKDGKVVFYHGKTRACKGTRFIEPAFDKMRKYFSDKAEFICADKLPFDEYMKVVERTNVIVDDANSYSIAMNGMFSLLKGKLIMGGSEPVANEAYGYEYNPVFNICPDVDQICDVIENIIERKDEIEQLGQEGRKFIEQYHNYIDIARQYVDIFNSKE